MALQLKILFTLRDYEVFIISESSHRRFSKKKCFLKFLKIHRKRAVFNKVAGRRNFEEHIFYRTPQNFHVDNPKINIKINQLK